VSWARGPDLFGAELELEAPQLLLQPLHLVLLRAGAMALRLHLRVVHRDLTLEPRHLRAALGPTAAPSTRLFEGRHEVLTASQLLRTLELLEHAVSIGLLLAQGVA